MARPVILRIAPSALRAGRLAGEAECIETGRRALVRDTQELLEFLRATSPPPDDAPPAEPVATGS